MLVALAAFSLFVAYDEIRFQFTSSKAQGTVTSVDKKFVGFSQGQTTGTKPNYQTTSRYTFIVDGRTYNGHYTIMSRRVGESVDIQYILGDPANNRAASSGFQSALLILISAIAFYGVWTCKRLLQPKEHVG